MSIFNRIFELRPKSNEMEKSGSPNIPTDPNYLNHLVKKKFAFLECSQFINIFALILKKDL